MNWGLTIAIAVVLLAFLWALPVHAQVGGSLCENHDAFVERMHAPPRWDKVAEGLKLGDILMEIFADPRGNWLLIWVWPNGQSCIMDVGAGWRTMVSKNGTI